MHVILWLLAGGLAGLFAFVALNLNTSHGVFTSVTIGMLSAFFGGHILAPVFGAGDPGAFSLVALCVAAATALACLSIAHIMSKRFAA